MGVYNIIYSFSMRWPQLQNLHNETPKPYVLRASFEKMNYEHENDIGDQPDNEVYRLADQIVRLKEWKILDELLELIKQNEVCNCPTEHREIVEYLKEKYYDELVRQGKYGYGE